MTKPTTLALDLEGTLISNAVSQIPRPELFWFLESCKSLFDRIVIYTAVNEDLFRKIANLLISERVAPPWFSDLEYINWDKNTKNLLNIPNANLQQVLLLDDRAEYIHPGQEKNWIMIEAFEPPYEMRDKALCKVIHNLVHRFTLP